MSPWKLAPPGARRIRRAARRRSLGQDEEATTMLVVEAILSAIIVLTAVVFLTSIGAPTTEQGATGIDLGRIAGDSLGILLAREAEDPTLYDNRLEEIVDLGLKGETESGHAFLKEILPAGSRYVLRVDNGVQPLTILPEGSGLETNPRSARAAEVFLLPNHTAHAPVVPNATAPPGGNLDWSTWTTLAGPNGETQGPNGTGTTWLEWWRWQEPEEDRIPQQALYGLWRYDDGSTDCPCHLRVHLPTGTETDRAPYAIQLVVWFAA